VQPKHTTHFAPNPTGNSKHETYREKKATKVDVPEQDGECEAMGLEPHPIAGVQCVHNPQMPHTVKLGSQEHSQAIVVAQAKLVERKAACNRNADTALATARQKTKVLQDHNDERQAKVDKANEIKQRLMKKVPQVKQPNYQQGGGASSSSLFTVAPPRATHASTPPAYLYTCKR
jgi:hypothetical protein